MAICFVAAIILIITDRNALKAAGTNIDPNRPTLAIVRSGLYRFSRNPLTLAYLGLTLLVNTAWGFLLLVPVLLLVHFEVVLREERYLQRNSGISTLNIARTSDAICKRRRARPVAPGLNRRAPRASSVC